MNTSTRDLRKVPDFVINYCAPFSASDRAEMVRRRRQEAQERAKNRLSGLITQLRELAQRGAGSWKTIADLLCSAKVTRQLQEAEVSVACVVEAAGLEPASLL